MLSQIIAVTGVNLRSIRQRLGSSAVAVFGIAGVVLVFVGGALDRRGVPERDAVHRRHRHRHGHARRRRQRDDQRPGRRACPHHPGRAGHRQGCGRTARVAGVVRRSSITRCAGAARTRTCRCAASSRPPSRCTPSCKIVAGPELRAGQERNHRRTRRRGPVRRPRRRHDREVGREHVAGGRDLRDRRIGRRVRVVVRREGAAARVPPRQLLPVRHCQARVARLLRHAQGLADHQSAADRHGHAPA